MPTKTEPRTVRERHDMVVSLNSFRSVCQGCIWAQPSLGFELLDVGTPELFGIVDESDRDVDGLTFGYDQLGDDGAVGGVDGLGEGDDVVLVCLEISVIERCQMEGMILVD